MALQGTLDTFALPDVLRLLAVTRKTGRLQVTGDRGSGAVWFHDGALRGAELGEGAIHELDEVLLQLLRSSEGSFVFDSVTPALRGDGSADESVDDVLGRVEELLEEWRAIEAAVPSPESWLQLAPDLATVDGGVEVISFAASEWALVVGLGIGATVDALLDTVTRDELLATVTRNELTVLRTLKGLVERGVVSVGEPPLGAAPVATAVVSADASSWVVPAPEVEVVPEPAPNAVRELEEAFAGRVDDVVARPSHHELIGLGTVGLSSERLERLDPAVSFAPIPDVTPYATPPFAGRGSSFGLEDEPGVGDVPLHGDESDSLLGDPDEAAEIARQLASLSPRAAKAVASAARAVTPEEREAALAAIEAEDETVNRGLLLKFLGSVDS